MLTPQVVEAMRPREPVIVADRFDEFLDLPPVGFVSRVRRAKLVPPSRRTRLRLKGRRRMLR